ncbi:MAG: hypothetical protein RIR70_1783 [Pseudomonadota bacterium]
MHVIVLGAGLAGVTACWYLQRDGHRVTLVDRQAGSGLETSFANGGQLSVSHPEPWANPHAPLQILRWLGREDAPLKFRPRADLAQWLWGLAFLRECLPGRTRANTEAIANLAQYSITQLRSLRAETGIVYDATTRGILHLFFDQKEFAESQARAQKLRSFGMRVELCPADRAIAIEPALARCTAPLAGALYAPDDESGDAHLFTARLSARCQQAGAQMRMNTQVTAIKMQNDRISGIEIEHQGSRDTLTADAYVLALGSHSAKLARQAGLRLMVYPVKGYSVTLPANDNAPQVSITDESRRIVFSRLGNRLRIAGTAELNGYDMQINRARAEAILHRALEIFPDAGAIDEAQFWTGLRPAVPSNRPYIGPTRVPNLFLNTGHGTLGWTLACGASRALADLIAGRNPQVIFPFTQV